MRKTIIFLQQLLATVSGISLTELPFQKPAIFEFLQTRTDYVFEAFLQKKHTFWHQLLLIPAQSNKGYELVLPGGVTFLFYAHSATDSVLCLGPVLTLTSHSQADEHIARFCTNLPVIASNTLQRTGDLVVKFLANEKSIDDVEVNGLVSPKVPVLHSVFTGGEDITQMRQVELRYEYSAALTDAVRQGNLSLALHLVEQYDPGTQTTVRNTNPLRNAQNYCIVLNTQLRHALEESGIHPYQVDKLSNEIGLEIEQLKNISQLPNFFQGVVRRYCRLVQEHAYPNLKPLTNLAVTYIKEHLADNLTVKDTAKALTVNANYLSSLFHKDMGMTFIDFVNRERTNQAAALLRHTNLQIQHIASTVGYNNTSYFTKQFVRFQGISPSSYRRETV